MPQQTNPYAPTRLSPPPEGVQPVRFGGIASFASGFFGGTALQWVLFWTKARYTEFPPMGGAVLGIVTVLVLRYPPFRQRPLIAAAGAILGNANAYWCSRYPLDTWNVPGDLWYAWPVAAAAFAVTLAATLGLCTVGELLLPTSSRERPRELTHRDT